MASFELNTKRKTQTRGNTATRDEDEYAGLWINVGFADVSTTPEGEEVTVFHRLPRGIAVSDLDDHKIFASTKANNPEWAESAALVNSIMDMVREAGLELEEGESTPINLQVQLYRRQEQVEQVAPASVDKNLKAALFG